VLQTRRTFLASPLAAGVAGPLAVLLDPGTGARAPTAGGERYEPSGADDADRIQALLDAAAPRAGSVLLAAGATPYQLGHSVRIPTAVSLVGESPGTRLVAAAPMDTMILVDAPLPLGNRLGTLANLALDGNGRADAGLTTKGCVQRSFERLSVTGCRLTGVRVVGSQNNLFTGLDIEHNGREVGDARHGGLELLAGAASNCFVRCEFNQNGGYQALLAGKGALPWTDPRGPSGNTFLACIFERRAPNTRGAIYAGDGRLNTWIRCDVSFEGSTMIEGPADPSSVCHLWRFYACSFTGSPDTVCISRGNRVFGVAFDWCLFESFKSISDGTTSDRVAVLPGNQVSGVRQWDAEAPSLTPSMRLPHAGWDTQHLILGDTHLWVDPRGDLRYLPRAPNGPYDGRRLLSEGS
jgi:hypothetical protein